MENKRDNKVTIATPEVKVKEKKSSMTFFIYNIFL